MVLFELPHPFMEPKSTKIRFFLQKKKFSFFNNESFYFLSIKIIPLKSLNEYHLFSSLGAEKTHIDYKNLKINKIE